MYIYIYTHIHRDDSGAAVHLAVPVRQGRGGLGDGLTADSHSMINSSYTTASTTTTTTTTTNYYC